MDTAGVVVFAVVFGLIGLLVVCTVIVKKCRKGAELPNVDIVTDVLDDGEYGSENILDYNDNDD